MWLKTKLDVIFTLGTVVALTISLVAITRAQNLPKTGIDPSDIRLLEFRVDENSSKILALQRSLDGVQHVEVEIALIKQQMSQMELTAKETLSSVSQMRTATFTAVTSLLCWVLIQLFKFFEQRRKGL